jgi:hypothetical protein
VEKAVAWALGDGRGAFVAVIDLFCYRVTSVGNGLYVASLTLTPKDIMAWRVALRPNTALLEVIDPEVWNQFTKEQQSTYQSVSLFGTEQEADKFAKVQVDAAKAVSSKLPRR